MQDDPPLDPEDDALSDVLDDATHHTTKCVQGGMISANG